MKLILYNEVHQPIPLNMFIKYLGTNKYYFIKRGIGDIDTMSEIDLENQLIDGNTFISPCLYVMIEDDFRFSKYFLPIKYKYDEQLDVMSVYCKEKLPYTLNWNIPNVYFSKYNTSTTRTGNKIFTNKENFNIIKPLEIKGSGYIIYLASTLRGRYIDTYKPYDEEEMSDYVSPSASSLYVYNTNTQTFDTRIDDIYLCAVPYDTNELEYENIVVPYFTGDFIQQPLYIIENNFDYQKWQNNVAFVRRLHNAHTIKQAKKGDN